MTTTNSRYQHLTLTELEAEEAALTAALEAVRGRVSPWLPIELAPYACHVLAARFMDDCGDWSMAVVASPPSKPFTHWMPLPPAPRPETSGSLKEFE
jgi:hypothetical protein